MAVCEDSSLLQIFSVEAQQVDDVAGEPHEHVRVVVRRVLLVQLECAPLGDEAPLGASIFSFSDVLQILITNVLINLVPRTPDDPTHARDD
eukprot:CAMPEP_0173408120 /NCGR_PEP_ID=MMETSP1356-20130122/68836_1 /TAXON_ID=77927 ORGANISM="Hemiselmis virescens, Strain PCC157" /NCGR_SAMPLE_ID=MMETSP1356 /ASSEMBLY_ACC=CAM_ASM_000847 /LENGTH=90 /DNA_ID=CAMNT_0014369369 /DNA_START=414 /DNA_END=684 /DNA_ORIENTATION=+